MISKNSLSNFQRKTVSDPEEDSTGSSPDTSSPDTQGKDDAGAGPDSSSSDSEGSKDKNDPGEGEENPMQEFWDSLDAQDKQELMAICKKAMMSGK